MVAACLISYIWFLLHFLGDRHFHSTSINNRVAGWRLEDIDDNLAADFDGSLSGLGVDLSVASYNMRSVVSVNDESHLSVVGEFRKKDN